MQLLENIESNILRTKNHKYETKNFDENILNYYSRNIKIIAMTCDYLNIDLSFINSYIFIQTKKYRR